MNKANFAKMMEESGKRGDRNEQSREKGQSNYPDYKPSSEFKIALTAMCSEDDYRLLENQFFSGKD